MCFAMGNAIRWLKLQISRIDPDLQEEEAKEILCDAIDSFIRERVTLAHIVIVKDGADTIDTDDVLLTYGYHPLVEKTLRYASEGGKRFNVVVVDDPFDGDGVQMVESLRALGIKVEYCPDISAVRGILHRCTGMMVGAEAVFSNGALYGRAGTADLAIMASEIDVGVIVLCEMINFTERLAVDSVTYNEIDPARSTETTFRLMFDTTREKYISGVVTEFGMSAPGSLSPILRKLEEL
jgi:translation initiation factor eIF-2B subunit delta